MSRRKRPTESEMRAARPGVKRWFTPREAGRTAFLMQRVTGLGLTVYFILHVFNIGTVTGGAVAWSDFLAYIDTPIGGSALVLMLAALGFHFINGVRLMLGELGLMLPRPRRPNYPYRPRFFNTVQRVLLALAVVAAVVFALLGYLFIFVGVSV